jgi:hypothetical protein
VLTRAYPMMVKGPAPLSRLTLDHETMLSHKSEVNPIKTRTLTLTVVIVVFTIPRPTPVPFTLRGAYVGAEHRLLQINDAVANIPSEPHEVRAQVTDVFVWNRYVVRRVSINSRNSSLTLPPLRRCAAVMNSGFALS